MISDNARVKIHHIAVVHIDGNGFGNIFRELNSVEETIFLSKQVKEAVLEAFIYSLQRVYTG